jgi:hypothetical protein
VPDTLAAPRTHLVAAWRRKPTSNNFPMNAVALRGGTPRALSYQLPACGVPMDALLRAHGSSGGDHL